MSKQWVKRKRSRCDECKDADEAPILHQDGFHYHGAQRCRARMWRDPSMRFMTAAEKKERKLEIKKEAKDDKLVLGSYSLHKEGWVCNLCGRVSFRKKPPKPHKPCRDCGTWFWGSTEDKLTKKEAKAVIALLKEMRKLPRMNFGGALRVNI